MWLPALLGLLSPPGGDRPRRTNLDETQLIQLAVTGAPLPTWGLPKEYSQRVDHFSKKEPPDAFAQRYFESDAHFDEANGAVVLYISGEAPLYAAPGSDTYTATSRRSCARGWWRSSTGTTATRTRSPR